MSATNVLCLLSFVFCLNFANSNIFFSDYTLPSVQIDKCKTVCDKNYKTTNDVCTAQGESCARGCRFFGIAEMITESSNLDLSIADEACHSSCDESYAKKPERRACISGCDIMSKQEREPISVATSFSFSFYFEDGDGVQLVQSGGDMEPDDVLTDPALRNQLGLTAGNQLGLNNAMVYSKLPEMKVRTLPVDDGKVETRPSECWWWLGAVVQTSHVPPCVLAALLILAVILLVKFTFFSEERASAAAFDDGCAPDLSAAKCRLVFAPSSSSEKYDAFAVPAIHKTMPPKYDEVINIMEAECCEAKKSPTEIV